MLKEVVPSCGDLVTRRDKPALVQETINTFAAGTGLSTQQGEDEEHEGRSDNTTAKSSTAPSPQGDPPGMLLFKWHIGIHIIFVNVVLIVRFAVDSQLMVCLQL